VWVGCVSVGRENFVLFFDARRGDAGALGSAALTGDRLRAETEAVPAAEVERESLD
jgi:hypothetical protein